MTSYGVLCGRQQVIDVLTAGRGHQTMPLSEPAVSTGGTGTRDPGQGPSQPTKTAAINPRFQHDAGDEASDGDQGADGADGAQTQLSRPARDPRRERIAVNLVRPSSTSRSSSRPSNGIESRALPLCPRWRSRGDAAVTVCRCSGRVTSSLTLASGLLRRGGRAAPRDVGDGLSLLCFYLWDWSPT